MFRTAERTFTTAERTYRSAEYTYRSAEYTYRSAEHNSNIGFTQFYTNLRDKIWIAKVIKNG